MAHPFRHSLVSLICAVFLCASPALRAQDFVIYENLEALQSRISRAGDTAIVVNFWATWCKPCVEELPCFDELFELYGSHNVQILLVSLDFKSQLEKKFIPFLNTHQLKPEVALMADQDLNAWIPAISEEWDGAIPATLVFKGKKSRFKLGKFDNIEDLENFVRPFVSDSAAQIIAKKKVGLDFCGGKK